jgi:glycosyltransferase involved in cell wall biosynthesis
VVLVSNAWSLVSRYKDCSELVDVAADSREHRHSFPQHRVVFLANDIVEQRLLHWQGLDATVFQHNGFYHRDAMPVLERRRDIDCVYVARIEPYKRLELMANLQSACVIASAVDEEYFGRMRTILPRVEFANEDPSNGEWSHLTPSEIAGWCARARCGLCLSAEEGAMFASMEYMLCGLPIVSTRSLGGRDVYFDEQYTLVCDDTPEAVATAVEAVLARDLPRRDIRDAALAKIARNRRMLTQFLLHTVPPNGGSLQPLFDRLNDIAYDFDFRGVRTLDSLMADIEGRSSSAT